MTISAQVHVYRRDFLKVVATGWALSASPLAPGGSAQAPRNGLLAADYTVVAQRPDAEHYIHDPAMTILPGGKLVAAVPIWRRASRPEGGNRTVSIILSEDKGATWRRVCEKPYAEAVLLVHEGRLYMFTQYRTFDGLWVTVSDDEGRNWAEAVEVIKGTPDRKLCLVQMGMVIRDGWLYWACSQEYREMGAVACDLRKGLLNPASWISSGLVGMPVPDALISGKFTDGNPTMRCLEGNIVDVHGRLLVIARALINRYGTANMAAVFDLERTGEKLNLSFRQLYPVPGGQCKFYILYDAPTRLFWMASNLPTNSQDLIQATTRFPNPFPGTPRTLREDRRILMLSYSLDALNWITAGCIAKADKSSQSFMYPVLAVDGDDLVVLARTARDSKDYHDADLATFHRVRDFRSLAMNLEPRM